MTLADIDISRDFNRINNRSPINLTVSGDTQEDILAVVRPVSLTEAKESQGRYTTEDVAFLISQIDIENSPVIGATVTEDGNDWTVLSVRKDRLTKRFRIVCRSSAVIGTVVIQTATFTLDAHGIQTTEWADSPEVPATVQKNSAGKEKEHQVEKMKTRYSVFFLSPQTITTNTRIKHGELILRPVGLQDLESLTELFTVEAEEW